MLDIHDPTYNENGLELSCGSHITTCTLPYGTSSHFLAHGFLRIVQAFSLFMFFWLSHAIVINLLECISGLCIY